jgi:hypothetical protein
MGDQLPALLSFLHDGETSPEPAAPAAPATDPAPQATPAVALRGGQLSTGEQARAIMELAWRSSRRRWLDTVRRQGGVVNWLMSTQPPSVLDQCEYAQSRAWVPAGHEGKFAEKEGVIFHATIGRGGVALGNAISAICSRQTSFWIAFFAFLLLAVTVTALILFA